LATAAASPNLPEETETELNSRQTKEQPNIPSIRNAMRTQPQSHSKHKFLISTATILTTAPKASKRATTPALATLTTAATHSTGQCVPVPAKDTEAIRTINL
jgi:hypothetical protein